MANPQCQDSLQNCLHDRQNAAPQYPLLLVPEPDTIKWKEDPPEAWVPYVLSHNIFKKEPTINSSPKLPWKFGTLPTEIRCNPSTFIFRKEVKNVLFNKFLSRWEPGLVSDSPVCFRLPLCHLPFIVPDNVLGWTHAILLSPYLPAYNYHMSIYILYSVIIVLSSNVFLFLPISSILFICTVSVKRSVTLMGHVHAI